MWVFIVFKLLNKLQRYFLQNNLYKEAAEIKEFEKYEEPWHEEAIKEFGKEPPDDEAVLKELEKLYEDEYKTRFRSDKSDLYNNIFKKHNFKMLFTDNPKLIGEGAYGKVFEGIYQGKPAVAKIIFGHLNEIDNWNKILEVKEQLNPDLKKHLPDIYLLDEDFIEYNYLKSKSYSTEQKYFYGIIIMEKLYPISSNVSEIILRNLNSLRDKAKNLWKDEDFIYEMSDSIKELLDSDFDNYKLSIRDIFKILINARISPQNNFLSLSVFSNSLSKEIINFIKSKLTEDELKDSYINMDLMEIEAAIEKLINYSFSKVVWPYKFEDYQEEKPLVYKYIPEISGIFKLLLELADREIKWADLHDANLMQDSQGTLKIIDVGLYDV